LALSRAHDLRCATGLFGVNYSFRSAAIIFRSAGTMFNLLFFRFLESQFSKFAPRGESWSKRIARVGLQTTIVIYICFAPASRTSFKTVIARDLDGAVSMSITENLDTRYKALTLNREPSIFSSLAEISAGQEVARWFLVVGAASGTVAIESPPP